LTSDGAISNEGALRTPPRLIIRRWMKHNGLKHSGAAKRLAISETVLAALKRGRALEERRCGIDRVQNVAAKIGCRPSELVLNCVN
jgi:hypothetical protein